MLVDPAFLTLIKSPPGRKKGGPQTKVKRKSRADNNLEQKNKAAFEAKTKRRSNKKNQEFDRYL